MLGAPLIFNLLFSHYLRRFEFKKKFLLFGIYLRSFSFFGMGVVTFFFVKSAPNITLIMFYFLILLFSLSGGFAGIAYSDIIGKLLTSEKRPRLYAARQFFSGIASLIGGVIISRLFKPGSFDYPLNYVLGMSVGCLGLIIGAFGFWRIKEQPSVIGNGNKNNEGLIGDKDHIFGADTNDA